ncbi:MAG: xanthine dehydrogenase family protein subunit M [Streptosporangiales bacterium]|nr:xanthine dehydrogenase family protein subunit M [Streptosporangiales bacterium]
MKPVDFVLHQPDTLAEALQLLAEHGDDGKVLAGGQSLVPLLNFRLARPAHVVDVGRIDALHEMRPGDGEVTVGAMVRQAAAEHSPDVTSQVPLLGAALPQIAHPPIRARGTVGGSLAHADPAAELPTVARALDATFVAASIRGRRTIPAAEFFQTHLTTALAADELLIRVVFPTAPDTGAAYHEVGRRRGDFALVGAAASLTVEDGVVTAARFALSGVADVPLRCTEAEELVRGRAVEEAAMRELREWARDTVTPPADLHATADYRAHVAGTLLARATRAAFGQTVDRVAA